MHYHAVATPDSDPTTWQDVLSPLDLASRATPDEYYIAQDDTVSTTRQLAQDDTASTTRQIA